MRSISLQKSRADKAERQSPGWAHHTVVTTIGKPVSLRSRGRIAPLLLKCSFDLSGIMAMCAC